MAGDSPQADPAQAAIATTRTAGFAFPARESASALREATAGLADGTLARLVDRPTLDALLEHVLAEAVEQLAATSAALFAFDAVGGTFQLRAFVLGAGALDGEVPLSFGAPMDTTGRGGLVGVADRPLADAWLHNDSPVEVAPPAWPCSLQCHATTPDASVLTVPVLLRGEPRGFAVVRFDHQSAPSSEQVDVARALAAQTALALEVLKVAGDATEGALRRERDASARERVTHLERTGGIFECAIETLASVVDADDIIPTVLRLASRTFASNSVGLFALDADARASLRCCLVDGRVFSAAEIFASTAGLPVIRRRFAGGFLFADEADRTTASANSRLPLRHRGSGAPGPTPDTRVREMGRVLEYSMTLRVADGAVEVLTVYRDADDPFTGAEVALAEALSKQLALAVERARLGAVARDRAVESAIARERERAAVNRADVLSRANEALRRGTARIAEHAGGMTSVLEAFVLEAIAATDAAGGVVARRVGGGDAEYKIEVLAHGGEISRGPQHQAPPTDCLAAAVYYAAAPGQRVPSAEQYIIPVTELEPLFPRAFAYHNKLGHRTLGHFPLVVAGVVTGYLGLAWSTEVAPDGCASETARALALQASLALETQRSADEAREAAVAAERQVASIAVAEERTRMAREMHDTLAQGLAGVVMQVAAARERLGSTSASAGPHLDLAEQLARETLRVARRAITVLRPGEPGVHGLDVGLRRVVAELELQRVTPIMLAMTGAPRRGPPEVEFELLRIVQAALANAAQHAGAQRIEVRLDFAADAGRTDTAEFRLSVSDDGAGFDPRVARPGHFGLIGMRERALRVGAAITLVTAPGEGTEVVLVWPGPTTGTVEQRSAE